MAGQGTGVAGVQVGQGHYTTRCTGSSYSITITVKLSTEKIHTLNMSVTRHLVMMTVHSTHNTSIITAPTPTHHRLEDGNKVW